MFCLSLAVEANPCACGISNEISPLPNTLGCNKRPKVPGGCNEKGISDHSDPAAFSGLGCCSDRFINITELADPVNQQLKFIDTVNQSEQQLSAEQLALQLFTAEQLAVQLFTVEPDA